MADNINLNLGSGGDVLAADDVASVKYQRVKLIQGADGTNDGDVSSAAPLNVTMANAVLAATAHAVTAKLATDALQDGTTALTPKFAAINAVVGEFNTIVAAVAGKKIRVLAVTLVGDTPSGTVRFEDGAAGTALTGVMPFGNNANIATKNHGIIEMPFSPAGWFETSVNTLLNLESLSVRARGLIVYVEVA